MKKVLIIYIFMSLFLFSCKNRTTKKNIVLDPFEQVIEYVNENATIDKSDNYAIEKTYNSINNLELHILKYKNADWSLSLKTIIENYDISIVFNNNDNIVLFSVTDNSKNDYATGELIIYDFYKNSPVTFRIYEIREKENDTKEYKDLFDYISSELIHITLNQFNDFLLTIELDLATFGFSKINETTIVKAQTLYKKQNEVYLRINEEINIFDYILKCPYGSTSVINTKDFNKSNGILSLNITGDAVAKKNGSTTIRYSINDKNEFIRFTVGDSYHNLFNYFKTEAMKGEYENNCYYNNYYNSFIVNYYSSQNLVSLKKYVDINDPIIYTEIFFPYNSTKVFDVVFNYYNIKMFYTINIYHNENANPKFIKYESLYGAVPTITLYDLASQSTGKSLNSNLSYLDLMMGMDFYCCYSLHDFGFVNYNSGIWV